MNKIAKIAALAALALTCVASTACADFNADKSITVISREEGSGTRGAFVELTGVEQKIDGKKVDMTTDDAQITNNTAAMLMTVAGDEQAIGYVSLGSLNDTVKAVKVEGVEATAENVADGSYKIARPFNIAYKADGQSDLSKDFVAYIMSAEGQAIINEHGYVGSNDAAAYAGNGAEGKLVVGGSSSVSPVMEKLIEAYKAVNANADIELQTTDSTTGMTSAIEGTALTPCSGCNSYRVTVGPQLTLVMVTFTPKLCRVVCNFMAVSRRWSSESPDAFRSPRFRKSTDGKTYSFFTGSLAISC